MSDDSMCDGCGMVVMAVPGLCIACSRPPNAHACGAGCGRSLPSPGKCLACVRRDPMPLGGDITWLFAGLLRTTTCGGCGAAVAAHGSCGACWVAWRGVQWADRLRSVFTRIPESYRDARLDGPELLARCRWAAERPRATLLRGHLAARVVIVVGASGEGKSTLAGALAAEVIELGTSSEAAFDRAMRLRWVGARDIVDLAAARKNHHGDGGDAYDRAIDSRVLIIDNLGAESSGKGSFSDADIARASADFLDRRYDAMRGRADMLTIVTTFGTAAKWREWYDDGIARRYWSGQGVVALTIAPAPSRQAVSS